MGERAKLGFKKGNRKARTNRKNNINFSEEKIDTKMKRHQRRQVKIQKEQFQDIQIENMNIEDLKEYILETEY